MIDLINNYQTFFVPWDECLLVCGTVAGNVRPCCAKHSPAQHRACTSGLQAFQSVDISISASIPRPSTLSNTNKPPKMAVGVGFASPESIN